MGPSSGTWIPWDYRDHQYCDPGSFGTVRLLQLQFHFEGFHVKFTSHGCLDKVWWKSGSHTRYSWNPLDPWTCHDDHDLGKLLNYFLKHQGPSLNTKLFCYVEQILMRVLLLANFKLPSYK